MFYSLAGSWTAELSDGLKHPMLLPGTLDENRIGYKDLAASSWHPDISLGNGDDKTIPDMPIATRFTRKYTYEGGVTFTRKIFYLPPEGKRVFLEAERARCLKLLIDGKEIPNFTKPSISTPHIFEITGLLNGDNEITLLSDNSYPGLPHDGIVYSSAATDETQTNWNGILGYLRLRIEEPVFLSAVRIYPKGSVLSIQVEIAADKFYAGKLTIQSEALAEPAFMDISVPAGIHQIKLSDLPLKSDALRWDEYEGNLYKLTAGITEFEEKTVQFGIRDFGDNGNGRLAVNGRTIFLRCEANCGEFPETGHPPMETTEWITVLERFKSYGINCLRFHSHCPPEAAFEAADQLGILMQPELSHWNPKNAFESEESYNYYRTELEQIILSLANHPSFVMLTFGNELWSGDLGHGRMSELLNLAHSLDDTRLYANGSNVHYGLIDCDQNSDFYTTQSFYQNKIRGTFAGMPDSSDSNEEDCNKESMAEEKVGIKGYINNQYPNAMTNYDAAMECIRKDYKKPVFSFEVGQFEVLPDFDELIEFQGISEPANLRLIQKRVGEKGLTGVWKQYVEATGELSRIGYREEIEAAMRTEQLSGISLLGLQDFPGQGTALVGMMNSHLKPKPFPFSDPDGFCGFFREELPLVYLPKYTFEAAEILKAEIGIANFGKHIIKGCPKYELKGKYITLTGSLPEVSCPMGSLTKAGILEIPLSKVKEASRLNLTVTLGNLTNTYPVWVYPPVSPVCPDTVYETERLDQRAKEVLRAGGTVYLSPDSTKEKLPFSIQAQFTTDFWSVGTFSKQEGGMGQLIDADHPIFERFPTETHTNWQWWPMAVQRAVIFKEPVKAIVTEMDSYAYMRHMVQLLECRCDNGKLMFSSLGLQNLQQYPEAKALLDAIYHYLDSDKFAPEQEISPELIQTLVR